MRCIPFSLSLFVLLGHDRVKSLLDLEHAVSSPSSPGSSPWSDATEGVVATATNSIFSVARRCVIVLESYPLSSESFVSCDHHSPTLTPSLPPSLYDHHLLPPLLHSLSPSLPHPLPTTHPPTASLPPSPPPSPSHPLPLSRYVASSFPCSIVLKDLTPPSHPLPPFLPLCGIIFLA